MYLLSQLQQVMTTRKSVHLKRVMKVIKQKKESIAGFYQPDTFYETSIINVVLENGG